MESPSQPAVFIQAGLKNTAIRNASANQGHTARRGTRATARWGTRQGLEAARSSLVGPVAGRPERRGVSS